LLELVNRYQEKAAALLTAYDDANGYANGVLPER